MALLAWLIHREGIENIFSLISLAGFSLVWLAVYRTIPVAIDSAGWLYLFPKNRHPRLARLCIARWIAESINTLLPVAQVGGHIIRARIIGRERNDQGESGAAVTVDFTIGLVTQLLFTLLGIVLLLLHTESYAGTSSLITGSIIAFAVIAAFFLTQRAGMFSIIARMASTLGRKKYADFLGSASALDRKITEIYSHRKRLTWCMTWRLMGWISKSGENWLFFHFIGIPITIGDAIILESMCTAFRSAAFFVPGGLGVQDGSLVMIGAFLGVGSESMMALALSKRFRELMVGIPGIVFWLAKRQ